MDRKNSPLKVALHGMDERSSKMMTMYLQGPCKGAAVVVEHNSSECDIFDIDSLNGQELLDRHLKNDLQRPVIVLSVRENALDNVFFIKKPVKTDDMLTTLDRVQSWQKPLPEVSSSSFISKTESSDSDIPLPTASVSQSSLEEDTGTTALKTYVIKTDEQQKSSKHEAAMQLSEKGFGAFIGAVTGIDVNDPKQFHKAHYNPKEYFQGYVDSAFKVSRAKGQTRQLNTGWNPLIIFPHNDEVWLDVDESQLRAFSGLAINKTLGSKMSISPLSPDGLAEHRRLDRFYSMDAFLWKVACWASKGRFPVTLDVNKPVYLKHWPNFTRLLVTPHGLRIAALLIKGPRTMGNIAEVLNIKPQYVFVFISAAYSLGLAGQVKREADMLVQSPEIQPSKNQSLLGRILSVLRGKKA